MPESPCVLIVGRQVRLSRADCEPPGFSAPPPLLLLRFTLLGHALTNSFIVASLHSLLHSFLVVFYSFEWIPMNYNTVSTQHPNFATLRTSIAPSYECVVSENNYLKHCVMWRDAVLAEQQQKIADLEAAQEQMRADAHRWQKFKQLVDAKRGQISASSLQKVIDSHDQPSV